VVENRGESACQLRARGRLRVVSLEGRDVRIRGNPGRVLIDWRLPRGGSLPSGWIWQNLCPSIGAWRLEATVAGLHAQSDTGTPPCLDRHRRSVLF
jgi:hypothetical protein